jgi:hypothetical protein
MPILAVLKAAARLARASISELSGMNYIAGIHSRTTQIVPQGFEI